jgi:sugar (pentulose or hexulose) kinase
VGKTSVKLTVADEEGRALETQTCASRVLDEPPYPHFDVEKTWGFITDTLAVLAKRHRVGCIVPVAHGACAAIVGDANLDLPILDYEHELSDVDRDYEPLARDFERTGSPELPHGLNLGRQLFWLERHHPEAFRKARFILPYPQYWAYQLSGVARTEITSLGCHTDLWQPSLRRFSAFAESRGYAARFAPMASAWQRIGRVDQSLAARTGLPASCEVLAGIHDSNASYFAHRAAMTDAFTVVSTGTWTVLMAAGRSTDGLDPARDMLVNVDALGDPVACARFMGGREYQAVAGERALGVDADDGAIKWIVDRGVMAHPQFADHGGPFRTSKGRITPEGWQPASPSEASALATLYTALVTDHCLELLGAAGDILVDGRMTQNHAWLSTLAALRPSQTVRTGDEVEGSVRGAAALAAWPKRLAPAPARACSPRALPGLETYRAAWRACLPDGGRSAKSSR